MLLYFKYMAVLLKSQMAYRFSFLLLTAGQCLTPFTVFAGLAFLFDRFGAVRGWSFHEVALVFAVTHLAFSITECFARGFDTFSSLVAGGGFDRLLVRPRSTVVQVLGSRFEFSRAGRLALGAAVLVWAAAGVDVEWGPLRIAVLALTIAGGIAVFAGIFILTAAISFWTIQGLEIANVLTDGGREMAQYPLTIYRRWTIRFFTYVIPFGCVNYLPLQYLLGREEGAPLHALAPLIGFAFLVPCLAVWRIGVRHYRSTGS